MIEFKNVSKEYPPNLVKESKVALQNITFTVKPGEFVTLCGRSGAGKTTILKMISCEEKPSSGVVMFDETNTLDVKKSDAYLIRQKIGFIFQDYKLLAYKTVYENVAYALEAFDFNPKLVRDEVMQVLELVGLENKVNCLPKELSGGEKQRVSIARALIHRPEIILADEPTGNLDPYHTREIVKILLKINESGSTVILSTHSRETVNSLEKRVITLENGRIIRDEEKGVFSL
ncbi:ATP-binding cassette domain-containing protein [bacterium]|jgi:cell division transport system ATP-binding protein|nr:ATP-binding cassette domain-containing protein [bacterium]